MSGLVGLGFSVVETDLVLIKRRVSPSVVNRPRKKDFVRSAAYAALAHGKAALSVRDLYMQCIEGTAVDQWPINRSGVREAQITAAVVDPSIVEMVAIRV